MAPANTPLLKVENLSKYFARGKGKLRAVHNISLELQAGQTLGVVGESGSGKSSLARTIIRLHEPDAGKITFDGVDFTALKGEPLRQKRREMQMIFQDPLASLSPMMTIADAIADPLNIHKVGTAAERRDRVAELMDLVGLDKGAANAFPFEFSGGQQQRIGIARALALNPKLVICDEPVSALDVSIQAQILKLLKELQDRLGVAYLFISHNLAVVEHLSDYIAVMYLGEVVELAPAKAIFTTPSHPYTRALMASVPRIPKPGEGPRKIQALQGEVPSATNPPPGCPFHTRCPIATDRCKVDIPEFRTIGENHKVACHFA